MHGNVVVVAIDIFEKRLFLDTMRASFAIEKIDIEVVRLGDRDR
jgi:hypothetical protein